MYTVPVLIIATSLVVLAITEFLRRGRPPVIPVANQDPKHQLQAVIGAAVHDAEE